MLLNFYKLASISTCRVNLLTPSFGEGKWKCKSLSPCWLFADCTHGLYGPWNSLARILEWLAVHFSRGSSQPRDWTQVSHISGWFLVDESPGKLKNTGVGSLSLLMGIFPTQESNLASHTAGRFFTSWAMKHAAFIREPYKESHGLIKSRFRSRFQKRLFFFFFFFKTKWGRESQVCDQLVHNSLIGWWWYNKLVS